MPQKETDSLFDGVGDVFRREGRQSPSDELTWARATLYRWKANACVRGRKQAEADCRRLLAFINSICPD